jgi:hypothetical protein
MMAPPREDVDDLLIENELSRQATLEQREVARATASTWGATGGEAVFSGMAPNVAQPPDQGECRLFSPLRLSPGPW